MHSRCIFFALHIDRDLAYTSLTRRWDEPSGPHFEDKTMNPIRIAKNWISYRRTMNELGNLSNHTLSDIGLTRYDIRDIASRSFR